MDDVQTISSDEEEQDFRPGRLHATPGWFQPNISCDVDKSSLPAHDHDNTQVQNNKWTFLRDSACSNSDSRKRGRLSDQDSPPAFRKRPHVNPSMGPDLLSFDTAQQRNFNAGFSVVSHPDPEGPSLLDRQRPSYPEPARHPPFHIVSRNIACQSPKRESNLAVEFDITSPVFNTRHRPSQLSDPVEVSSSEDSEDSFLWNSSQMAPPVRNFHEVREAVTVDVILSDNEDEIPPSQLTAAEKNSNRFLSSFNGRTVRDFDYRGPNSAIGEVGNCSAESELESPTLRKVPNKFQCLNLDVRKSVSSNLPQIRDPMAAHCTSFISPPRGGTHSSFKIPVIVADCDDKSHASCRSRTLPVSLNIAPLSSYTSQAAAWIRAARVPSPQPSAEVLPECKVVLKDAMDYRVSDGGGDVRWTCGARKLADERRPAAETEPNSAICSGRNPTIHQGSTEVALSNRVRKQSFSWVQGDSESQSVLGDHVTDANRLFDVPIKPVTQPTLVSAGLNVTVQRLSGLTDRGNDAPPCIFSDDDLFDDDTLTQCDEAIAKASHTNNNTSEFKDPFDAVVKDNPTKMPQNPPNAKIGVRCQGEFSGEAGAAAKSPLYVYSQQDETIILSDSDDEIFANLTQAVMNPKMIHDSDDETVDDGWNDDDDIDATMLMLDDSCFVVPQYEDAMGVETKGGNQMDCGVKSEDCERGMSSGVKVEDGRSCGEVELEAGNQTDEEMDCGIKSGYCDRQVSREIISRVMVEDARSDVEARPEPENQVDEKVACGMKSGYSEKPGYCEWQGERQIGSGVRDVRSCMEVEPELEAGNQTDEDVAYGVKSEYYQRQGSRETSTGVKVKDARSYGVVVVEPEEVDYAPHEISTFEEEDIHENRDCNSALKSAAEEAAAHPTFIRDPETAAAHGPARRVVGMITERSSDAEEEEDDVPIGELIDKQRYQRLSLKKYTEVKPLSARKHSMPSGSTEKKSAFDFGSESDEEDSPDLPRFDLSRSCLLLPKDMKIRSPREILEVEIDEEPAPLCARTPGRDPCDGHDVEPGEPGDLSAELELDAEEEEICRIYMKDVETKVTKVNDLRCDLLEKSDLVLEYYKFKERDRWLSKTSPAKPRIHSPRKRQGPTERNRKQTERNRKRTKSDATPEKRKKRSASEDQGIKIAHLREGCTLLKKKAPRVGSDNRGCDGGTKDDQRIENAKNVMKERAKQVEKENKERAAGRKTSGHERGDPRKVSHRRKTLPETFSSTEKVSAGSVVQPIRSGERRLSVEEASASRTDFSVLDPLAEILGPAADISFVPAGTTKSGAKRQRTSTSTDNASRKHSDVSEKTSERSGGEFVGVFKRPTARNIVRSGEKNTAFKIPRLSSKETDVAPAHSSSVTESVGTRDLVGTGSSSSLEPGSKDARAVKQAEVAAVCKKDTFKEMSAETPSNGSNLLKRKLDGVASERKSSTVGSRADIELKKTSAIAINSTKTTHQSVSSKHPVSKSSAPVASESSVSKSSKHVPVPSGVPAPPRSSSSVASKSSGSSKSSTHITSKLLPETSKSLSSVSSKSLVSDSSKSLSSDLSKSSSSDLLKSSSSISSKLSSSVSSKSLVSNSSKSLVSDLSKSSTSVSSSKHRKTLDGSHDTLPSSSKKDDPHKMRSASALSVNSRTRTGHETSTSKSDRKGSGRSYDHHRIEFYKLGSKNVSLAESGDAPAPRKAESGRTKSSAARKSRSESSEMADSREDQPAPVLTDFEKSSTLGTDKPGCNLVGATSLEGDSTLLDKQVNVAVNTTTASDVERSISKVGQPLSVSDKLVMQPPASTMTTTKENQSESREELSTENQSETRDKLLDSGQMVGKKPAENQPDVVPPVNEMVENNLEAVNEPVENLGGSTIEANQTTGGIVRLNPEETSHSGFVEPSVPVGVVRPVTKGALKQLTREVVRTTAPALGREVESITLSQIVNDSIRKTAPMPSPLLAKVAPRNRVQLDIGHPSRPAPERESRVLTTLEKAKVPADSYLCKNKFTSTILFWNAVWMQECEKVKALPPIVNFDKVYPLLDTYDNFKDYTDILQPLMHLELWESMVKDWKDGQRSNRQRSSLVMATYLNIEKVKIDKVKEQKLMFLHCQGVLTQQESVTGRYLKESDLVIVNLRSMLVPPKGQPPDPKTITIKPVFGIVSRVNRPGPGRMQEALHTKIEELRKTMKGRCSIITYIIEFAYRHQPIDNSDFISIEPVTSILTTLRQFSGLANLPGSALAAEILRPSQWEVFHHNLEIGANQLKDRFNPSQTDAISKITKAVLEPYYPPKICLLQGPPGTGKSHTVVGLIEHLLAQNSNFHILLCAPSNAGIDELCRRLIACNRMERPGSRKGISFVRLGATSSIHPEIQPYSLQVLAKKKYEQQQKNAPTSVQSTLLNLDQKQKEWKAKLDKCLKENNTDEAEIARKELKSLEKRKENISGGLSKRMSAAEEVRMKKEVLMGVNVVCSTLNHSGSQHIVEMMHHKDATKCHFGCVIVDEACQCTEVDCLIPLQYKSSKLVLVGDPEQLPPTVLSKKASDMRYGQSLFERLYNQLKPSPSSNQSNPVLMLQVQYRMHEEICHFSSKHFYNNQLKTNPNTAKKRSQFRSRPFSVFDLQYSCENSDQRGLSLSNPQEADFIVQLCQHLASWMTSEKAVENIGIITPYQSQKTLIIELLRQRCRELCDIEVGTVDGFQGREKDVIIVSCVRANSSRNIGFLADRRRMNVSLTRAKYALYIVGHMKTLTSDENWSALVADAQLRGRLVKVTTAQQSLTQIQHGCSKS